MVGPLDIVRMCILGRRLGLKGEGGGQLPNITEVSITLQTRYHALSEQPNPGHYQVWPLLF